MASGSESDLKISAKQRLALVTLTKELMQQLNEVVTLKKSNQEWEASFQVFREMSLILEYIPEHLQQAYLDTLPVLVSDDPPDRRFEVDRSYVDLSLTYKRALITRLSSELIVDQV